MNIRLGASVALLIAAAITVVATAGVAAMTIADEPLELGQVIDGWSVRADAGTLNVPDPERGAVLSASPPVVRARPGPGRHDDPIGLRRT